MIYPVDSFIQLFFTAGARKTKRQKEMLPNLQQYIVCLGGRSSFSLSKSQISYLDLLSTKLMAPLASSTRDLGMILCRAFSIIFLYLTRFVEFSVELIPFASYTKLLQMNVTMRRIWSLVRMKWKRGTVEM